MSISAPPRPAAGPRLHLPARTAGAFLLCLALACAAGTPASPDPDRRFEVMHFWTSNAERRALNVLREEFVRRHDVNWVDSALPSFDQVRKQTLQRIIDGYPPHAVLWHPSPDVWSLYDMQVIHPVTEVAREQRWRDRLPEVAVDTLVTGGEFVAVPTNLHGENLVFYSAKIYKELGLDYPESWEQLLKQATLINKAGYVAVAVGEPDWEKRLMYSTILSSLDPDAYLDLLGKGESEFVQRPEVLEAFRIMAELRDLSRTDIAQPNGAAASVLIGDGRAGMQFIGDWINQELKNRGRAPGVDYECRLVPGGEAAYMIVVDGFILPVAGGDKHDLHHKFAEVALDPEVQVEFALAKGAIPVVKGLSDPRFDRCSRIGIEALKDGRRLTPSSAMLSITSYGAVVQSVAAQLWQSDMTPGRAVELLRRELDVVRELEQAP